MIVEKRQRPTWLNSFNPKRRPAQLQGERIAVDAIDAMLDDLAEGVLALALLIALQYAVTWSSVRVAWVRKLVTGEPALLFYRGRFLGEALSKARVALDIADSTKRVISTRSAEIPSSCS